MKRFTSLLLAALIGVFAYAQAPLKFNTEKLRTVQTQVAPVAVQGTMSNLPATALAKRIKAKAPKKAPASAAELAGSYKWEYATASERAEDPSTVTQTAGSANVTVTVADDVVTISGMFTNDLTATYDAENGAIVLNEDQVAGTSSYGDYIIRGLFYYAGDDSYQAGWYYTSIVGYVNNEGVITFENWIVRVLSGGTYDGYSLTPYFVAGSTLTPSDPVTVVTLPEDAEPVEYSLTYDGGSGAAAVAVVGNDVYFQGLSHYFPEAWVKGTKSGNQVTFPGNQYVGTYGSYGDSYAFYNGTTIFTYDPVTESYSATGQVFGVLGGQYYDGNYTNPVLTKVVEKAAMPANPSITSLENTNYGYIIRINVPNVDTEGNGLVGSKLFYEIFTDTEHAVSQLTFTPTTHTQLTEEMTTIPFGFTDNYDFDNGIIYLNELYSADWNKIGIKSIYYGGGETNETEIQWYNIKDYAEVIALNNLNTAIQSAETQVADENNPLGRTALQTAIDAAKAVAENTDATIDELNAALTALNTAVAEFTTLNQAYNSLKTEVATAGTLKNDYEAAGKTEGLSDLEAAIATANAVLSNADATADELNAAIAALQAAEEAFKEANKTLEEKNTITAQWVANQQGYANAEAVEAFTIVEGGITATVDKGTGNTAPAYYNTGTALRLYGGNVLTINATSSVKKITSIVFTTGSNNYSGRNLTADAGELNVSGTTATWTGDATSVAFTQGGTSGHARITAIAVTYVNQYLEEGTYYIYNALTQKFLSRGDAWGTRAVVDDYGFPINVTLANGRYTLSNVDGSGPYGDDYWMYADAGGDRTRTFTAEAVDGGFYLRDQLEAPNNRVYVYTKDDADKYAVAGNATPDENITDDAQTVWQFLTQAERDAIIAARETAARDAAFEAAEINEEETIVEGEPVSVSVTTGNAWTQNVVRTQDGQPVVNDYGMEMWQATGSFTQTLENIPAGLYKLTVNAFYRDGNNAAVADFTNQGYNLSVAYLEANGNKAQIKSWGIDRIDDGAPNDMATAASLFAEGKYQSEVYAVVGEDGKLDLKLANPSYIGNGWFIVGNVTYAKVENKPAVNIYELISINPAEGEVESLQSFQITFGGEVVTVNEDIFPTLDGQDGGIAVSADGKTVSIDFEEAVTAAGSYQLDIPAGAILYNGAALDPLAFRYTIKGAEYTIDPAEGEVEKLENFTITFNNYMVDVNDEEAKAILFNEETEAEIEATGIYAIGGNKQVYITFPEVTTPGKYQLIIMDASIQKIIDDSYLPELTFNYTISIPDGIQGVAGEGNNVRYFDATGRAVNSNAKGVIIQQTRQADGTVKTIKVVRK